MDPMDLSTCYVQHEVFDEVTHDSVSHSNNDQSGHQEVEDGFRELDEVPGRRLVLFVKWLHILDQVLEWKSSFVCVVKAVHIPGASTSSSDEKLFHYIQSENVPSLTDSLAEMSLPKKCRQADTAKLLINFYKGKWKNVMRIYSNSHLNLPLNYYYYFW